MPDFLSRLADRSQTSNVEARLRPASVPRFAALRTDSAGGVPAAKTHAGEVPGEEGAFGQMSGGPGVAHDEPRQPVESLPRDPHAARQRAFEQRLDEMFSSPAFAGAPSRPAQHDGSRRPPTHDTPSSRRPADGTPTQGQLEQHQPMQAQSEQGQSKQEQSGWPAASQRSVSGFSATDSSSGTRQADRVAAGPDGTVQPRSTGPAAARHDQDAAEIPVASSPRSGLKPVRPRSSAPSSTRASEPTSVASDRAPSDRAPSGRAPSDRAPGNRLGPESVVQERTVRVRIGRVEVRNVTPAPAASTPRTATAGKRPPPPSLDDYLRRRREGR